MTDKEETERLREALDRIAWPIYWMKKEAEETGARLNGGMAIALADDPNYLREIARKALENN